MTRRKKPLSERKKLTVDDIARDLGDQLRDTSIERCSDIVKDVFDVITEALRNEENVSIPKFGTFCRSYVRARSVYNINTGQFGTTPAKWRIKFRCSKKLIYAMNPQLRASGGRP